MDASKSASTSSEPSKRGRMDGRIREMSARLANLSARVDSLAEAVIDLAEELDRLRAEKGETHALKETQTCSAQ
jgi:hypothetical protein